MSDVRAAAERMRDHAWLERFRKANYDNSFNLLSPTACNDIARYVDKFIDTVLAEHPADESLDVDEDWLVQIGFQPDASGALWIGDYRLCWFGQGFFGFDGVEVESKTRGDVRRMCRVFGVEVKE